MKETTISLESLVELLYRLNVGPEKVRMLADMKDDDTLRQVARELRELYNQNGFYANYY